MVCGILCKIILQTKILCAVQQVGDLNFSNFKRFNDVKRLLLTLTVLLSVLSFGLQAKVIFVQAGSEGQGSSWEDALGNLQDALLLAQAGDQVWVASGVYTPTMEADRTVAFIVPDGIELYGGFAGNEGVIEERNFIENPTILSGEIGDATTNEDNSYTVVLTIGVSAATLIDGFTISDGTANGFSEGGDLTSSGAGWFNDATAQPSSPVIKNCIFTNNFAREGAAIYNYAQGGESRAMIASCTFTTNHADFDGGAIYNNGNYGVCSPRITNCVFLENDSYYGAGILCKATRGESKPVIEDCVFAANVSVVRGSAIYCYREPKSICEAILKSCRFEENASTVDETLGGNAKEEVSDASASPAIIIRPTSYED